MAVPSYVSTEWVGLGHATLRFRPKKVPYVESLPQAQVSEAVGDDGTSPHPCKSMWAWWWPVSWKKDQEQQQQQQQPVETHKMECYLSAVYIMEYGEKKKSKVPKERRKIREEEEDEKEEEELEEVKEEEEQEDVKEEEEQEDEKEEEKLPSNINEQEDKLRPPGIANEVWNAWLEHWEAWREVLIPLSWVHKYREHCTTDYITWHDSYLIDYPEILPLITDDLGRSELKGIVKETNACEIASSDSEVDLTEFYDFMDGTEIVYEDGELRMNDDMNTTTTTTTTTTEGDVGNRKMLDDLYDKHTKKRYLVHLRSFLHQSGVVCDQNIATFFEREAGIDFFNTHTTAHTDGTLNTEINDTERTNPTLEENIDNYSDGKMELTSNEKSIQEELHQNSSCDPLVVSESVREGCGDEEEDMRILEPHVTEGVRDRDNSGSEGERESVYKEQINTSSHHQHQHNTSKKNKRNQDAVRSQGISWALKYVQKETVCQDEEKIAQTSEILPVTSMTLDPNAGVARSLEAASETPEAEEKSHPTTNLNTADDVDAVDVDAATTLSSLRHQNIRKIIDEMVDSSEFFELMDELDLKYQKKSDKSYEEKLMREMLKEPPTRFQKVLTALKSTAQNLAGVLLPYTLFHCLNLAFPGAAVVEYESSVTEEVPGEKTIFLRDFHFFVYAQKRNIKRVVPRVKHRCIAFLKETVAPLGVRHLINLVFEAALENQHDFPSTVFGVRWLPQPDATLSMDSKNIKRQHRRFHRWLEVQNPNLSPSCTVQVGGLIMYRVNPDPDPRKPRRVYQQVLREEGETEDTCNHLTLHTFHPLSKVDECGSGGEVECSATDDITLTKDGNFRCVNNKNDDDDDSTTEQTQDSEDAEVEAWNEVISGCHRLSYWDAKSSSFPSHLPEEIRKYWAQRYRLFLKYDQGIILDNESWYSVTPEFLAAHQARRCRCEVVVDAMCGGGGNAIQLAKTCSRVIAIDKDPRKVELARHNAEVYGVADRIEFRVGNFFKLAPYIKADVVYLSPPWGGMEYLEEGEYNVYRLGGTMNSAHLLRTARSVTPNVALYLPRNSDLCQVIALAGVDGVVDIETNFMGPKKKAITVYFGDLAAKGP